MSTPESLSALKPDFERVRDRWNHFWAREFVGRPLVVAEVTRPGHPQVGTGPRYRNAIEGHWREQLALVDVWLEATDFVAESIPFFAPDFGPDQFAAFLGAELRCVEGSDGTSWVDPIVEDWERTLPLRLDPRNRTWQRILEYSRLLADHARGRYLVGVCDLHSNADALLALRGGERLCTDLYECPELVERAMLDVRQAYASVYEGLYQAGAMSRATGTIGWIPFWCEGRYATIQCDFICMVSPALARRFILPAIEEEASFLDHCIYHLDGPGALRHLDDILAIERIDAIQWVSGAGQPLMHTWLDVLRRCQKAGKALQIHDLDIEQAKALHSELSPAGLVYCVNARTRAEVEEFCSWLERHS